MAAEGWTRDGAVAGVPGAQLGPVGVVCGGTSQSAAASHGRARRCRAPAFCFKLGVS